MAGTPVSLRDPSFARPTNSAAGSPAAIAAARAYRNYNSARGRDHLGALYRRILRRDFLDLHALGRDHDGLRHHDGLVARGRAMREALAGRNYDGLVGGRVLWRDQLPLMGG